MVQRDLTFRGIGPHHLAAQFIYLEVLTGRSPGGTLLAGVASGQSNNTQQ